MVISVLDGAHIDEGVAFEVGFAFALGKPCVGLQTDTRRQLPTGNNPMLNRSLSPIFQTQQHLLEWVQHFVESQSRGFSRRAAIVGVTSRPCIMND